MFLFATTLIWADTPWNRPDSLRIIPHVPKNWQELTEQTQMDVRIFWDQQESASIQMLGVRGWEDIATDVHSGYIIPKASIDAQFRIRLQSGIRYSPVTHITLWYNPQEIATLYNSQEIASKIPRTTISEIEIEDQQIWVSTLGFGFFGTDLTGNLLPVSQEQKFSRWNGLLSTQVLSLDTHHDQILIGTAQGAQLWNSSGALLQTWTTELPHPYTQRVYLDDFQKLIGTYKGLYDPTKKEIYLSPWSVFSMYPIDKTLWVGYDGLQKFDLSKRDIVTVNNELGTIYDIVSSQNTLYVSSKIGLYRVFIEESPLRFEEISPYVGNLLFVQDPETQPWFAIENDGLLRPDGTIWNKLSWQQDLELSAIYAVVIANVQGIPTAFVGGSEGLRIIKNPQNNDITDTKNPSSQDIWKPYGMNANRYFYDWKTIHYVENNKGFTKKLPSPIIDIHQDTFVLRDLVIFEKQHEVQPPSPLISATHWLSRLWVSTEKGVYRYETEEQLWKQQDYVPAMVDLQASQEILWGLGEDGIPYRIQPLKAYLRLFGSGAIAPSKKSLCILKDGDLWMIHPFAEDDVVELYTPHDILAITGDQEGGCYYVSEDGQIGHITTDGEHTYGYIEEFTTIYALNIDNEGFLWVLSSSGPYVVYPEHLR